MGMTGEVGVGFFFSERSMLNICFFVLLLLNCIYDCGQIALSWC